MAQTLQQIIAELPRTADGKVPKQVRLYVMRVVFLAGGEYSEAEFAEPLGVSLDTIQRDIHDLQDCPWVRLPLVCRKVQETRWRLESAENS
jgi:predicted DNA-binding transcriptional regulator YafY